MEDREEGRGRERERGRGEGRRRGQGTLGYQDFTRCFGETGSPKVLAPPLQHLSLAWERGESFGGQGGEEVRERGSERVGIRFGHVAFRARETVEFKLRRQLCKILS